MIIAKNLVKIYDNRKVIDDISFNIDKGDFVGIIGESGAGKSTLLYLLSGLIKLDDGAIIVNNEIISSYDDYHLSKWRKENTSFVFQNNNLVPELSVKDNLEIALSIKQNSLKFDQKRIFEVLEDVNMKDSYLKIVGTLSGGQKQRIAVARALICDDNILFSDEPTGSLDSGNAQTILELFNLANKKYNKTIIMVTHSEKQLKYCSKIIKIKDGKID